jgi:hypothetical protein
MTESAAICQYLVSRYGPSPLDVAPEEPGYAAFLNGLHFGEATLTFPQTLVLRYRRLEPPERRLPQAAEDYERWFLSRLRKGLGRWKAASTPLAGSPRPMSPSATPCCWPASSGWTRSSRRRWRPTGPAFSPARLPARPGGAASGSGDTERTADGLQRAGFVLIRQPARPDFAVRGPQGDEGGYDDRIGDRPRP